MVDIRMEAPAITQVLVTINHNADALLGAGPKVTSGKSNAILGAKGDLLAQLVRAHAQRHEQRLEFEDPNDLRGVLHGEVNDDHD